MAKGSSEAYAYLIVIAVIAAPFILLYNAVGAFWFWIIVIGIPLMFGAVWFKKEYEKAKAGELRKQAVVAETPEQPVPLSLSDAQEYGRLKHALEIEMAWLRGDFDWARAQLQQISYSLVGKSVPQKKKDEFKQLMTEFASVDPLYRQVMDHFGPVIRDNPGLVQSQIYKGESDDIKEQMRYVLYFAHELGEIVRVKKGSSYRLYPAGTVFDSDGKPSAQSATVLNTPPKAENRAR